MQKPTPHSHWRHYKSTGWVDHTYEVIGIARHSETHEDMVVYKPLYPIIWGWLFPRGIAVRPLSMWYDIIEYEWKKVQRFTEI